MMHRSLQLALGTLLFACAAAGGTAAQTGPIDYRNERFGFSLSVPSELIVQETPDNAEAGGSWVSRDGQARLLVAAGVNETGETLKSYREFVMRETYRRARFDYAPVRQRWFVLSGIKGDQMFYERVNFVCDGRYIYGWQMMYPISERRRWDPVVEAIHRSYRPGAGEDGACQ
jgi:hypothetical protein